MKEYNFNLGDLDCVKCGATIGNLSKCHSCGYVQENIYDDPETKQYLEMSDYNLALLFFPNCMVDNFRLFNEYAFEIRKKLVSFEGRKGLSKLTEGRNDGWVFDNKVF